MRENYRLYKLYKMVQKGGGNNSSTTVNIDYSLLSGNDYVVEFVNDPTSFLVNTNKMINFIPGTTTSITGHYKGGGQPDAALGNYFQKATNEIVRHKDKNNVITYYAYFSEETLPLATALTDTSAYTTPGYYTIDYNTMSIIERVGSNLELHFTYEMNSIRAIFKILPEGGRLWIDINTENEKEWEAGFSTLIKNIRPYEKTVEVIQLENILAQRPDTSDATAISNDIIAGKTAYAQNIKIEGAMERYIGDYEGIASVENEWGEVLINLVDRNLSTKVAKLPEGLTSIGKYAFYQNENLGLQELPSTLITIEDYAFQKCTNMPLKTIKEGLTTIGSSVFNGCSKLTVNKLPETLTSIGQYAFQNCTSLALTELPTGLTSLSNAVFSGCTKLALTKLPDSLLTIGTSTFSGCSVLAFQELSSSITTIGNYAFQNCINLAITNVPDNVTSLGTGAFKGCSKLTNIEVSANVKTINSYTFQSCSNLQNVILKGELSSIGNQAFNACPKLTQLVLPNIIKVPALNNANTFTDTPIASGTGYIYVPDDLVDSFKTTSKWSTYANQIKPISEMEG